MHLSDTYALATILPVLAQEFGVSPVRLKPLLTVYLFVAAMMIPISGWLADRWGALRVFRLSIASFLLGSVFCAISDNQYELILSRAVQGLGGGVMVPVARLITVRGSSKSDLVRTMNWFTAPAIFGPMLGPPLAGFLVENVSWHWVFLMNVPIGIAALGWTLVSLREVDYPKPGKLDTVGVMLLSLALLAVMFAANVIGASEVSVLTITFLLALAVVLSFWAVKFCLRSANPVLNFRLFKLNSFRAALLGGALLRMSLGATPFLLPIMLQNTMGWSPSQGGTVLFWAALGALAGRFFASRSIDTFGFRGVLISSGLVASCLVMVPGFYSPHTASLFIFSIAVSTNFMFTIHYAAANVLVFAEVADDMINPASTLSVVAQQISLSLGISLGAMALLFSAHQSGGELSSASFRLPFLVLGGVGLFAIPFYAALHSGVGDDMKRDVR
ncbi:MAG: MFS transporter [Luminiphilus sp.]|jgi:EmrB/QacA subfamily drug resistance transporter|nr:MFS transporter [Luminiphilus sp.]